MAFLVAGLQPPTNIARRVRRLQESLYRRWGLLSPLALPPLIPLAFFDPGAGAAGAGSPGGVPDTLPSHSAARVVRRLAEELRSAFRGESAPRAPRLRTAGLAVAGEPVAGSVAAALFWELGVGPDRGTARAALAALADLVRARVETGPGWPPLLTPPFPVHAGFFLALQEPELDLREVAAALAPPEPLSFPAAALTLLRVRRLHQEPFPDEAVPAAGMAAAPAPGSAAALEQPPWWRALFWEELLNVPLKKPPREAPQETG